MAFQVCDILFLSLSFSTFHSDRLQIRSKSYNFHYALYNASLESYSFLRHTRPTPALKTFLPSFSQLAFREAISTVEERGRVGKFEINIRGTSFKIKPHLTVYLERPVTSFSKQYISLGWNSGTYKRVAAVETIDAEESSHNYTTTNGILITPQHFQLLQQNDQTDWEDIRDFLISH